MNAVRSRLGKRLGGRIGRLAALALLLLPVVVAACNTKGGGPGY